jgi:16S rRNA (guanine527-N7)-methyltransferase
MFHVKHSALTATVIRQHGLVASEGQLELLDQYVSLVLEWNARINLISRKDEENIWVQHLMHSIAPLFVLSLPEKLVVMDLGSGGGFPGIPLAILNPGWTVVLVDSIRKKTLALEDMVARLGLASVRVITGRVEEKDVLASMRGKCDLILARGVAPLAKLVVWSRPFARRGSGNSAGIRRAGGGESEQYLLPLLLAYKGGDLAAEIREAQIKAGVKQAGLVNLTFPGGEGMEKKLVLVRL